VDRRKATASSESRYHESSASRCVSRLPRRALRAGWLRPTVPIRAPRKDKGGVTRRAQPRQSLRDPGPGWRQGLPRRGTCPFTRDARSAKITTVWAVSRRSVFLGRRAGLVGASAGAVSFPLDVAISAWVGKNLEGLRDLQGFSSAGRIFPILHTQPNSFPSCGASN
jgi:hypothetical protein